MAGLAGIFEVTKPVAVPAEVEGLAGLGVMVALTTPVAGIELDMRAVHPGVIKCVVASIDFIGAHKVGGGILKDYLQGELVVGIGMGEGGCTVVAVFLELKEVLSHFCDIAGRVVDAGIKGAVVYDFCVEGVVLL